jgi:hypothetical protein
MFLHVVCLCLIPSWLLVNCVVPVPPLYRKAELALNRYISAPSYNPVIHSLLNVLIHVKQAKAFISDEAIESALEEVKDFDQNTKINNEQLFRQVIYGRNCKKGDNNCDPSNRRKINPPTPDLKQRIVAELDKFFATINTDESWTNNAHKKNKA